MPYLNDIDAEEQRKKQEAQGGPQAIAGQSSVINGNSSQQPGGQKESGSYTNLNQYLEANKEQAAGMGAKIATDVSTQGAQTRDSINQTSQDFSSLADKGTIKNINTANQESSDIVRKAQTSAQNDQINDNQLARFGEISTAQYKGPQDIYGSQYAATAQQNVAKANENKNAVNTEEGRFNLLTNAYAKPQYSQGQKKLDNMLVQRNDVAKANIQNAAQGLGDIQGLWDTAGQTAANLAKQRTDLSNQVRNQAQQGLEAGRTQRTNEVNTALDTTKANWSNEYNRLNDLLSGYKGGDLELSQADVNKFGLTGDNQGIYNLLNGVDPKAYLDLKAFDANKVVSKDQFSQLSALDKLAQQYGGASTSRFSDINQAGTLGLDNNLDATGFGKAAVGAETGFQNTAGNTNIDARGYNDQSWYGGGILGNDKHWVNAVGQVTGNVKNYLDTGAFNVNGQTANTSEIGVGAAINPAWDAYANLVGSIGLDWFGGGKQAEAQRAAQSGANQQAAQNYFNQLNSFLDQQGYKNRVKVK